MKTIFLMLCITLLCANLFAQEEVKTKDGRTIILNNDGTWKSKQVSSQDSRNEKGYKTVKIGSQIWMVENLNVSCFRNGDLVPEVRSYEEWLEAGEKGKPAWCYYDNNPENGKKYGKLYNWYAVNDKRGLAPEGWHIPTQSELRSLARAVDNSGNALKAIGEGMENAAGTNSSGFTGLLTGYRFYSSGGPTINFHVLGASTYFWSSTQYNGTLAATLNLSFNDKGVSFDDRSEKGSGYSVRCVKD